MRTAITVALIVAATVLLLEGCAGRAFRLGRTPPPTAEVSEPVLVGGQPMLSESDRPGELGGREGTVTLQITFEALRVDIPVLGIRHSLKIWNHVDETQSDPRITALLARNGLRCGIASAEAWPALQVLFEANHAKSLHTREVVQSGAPLSLCLGEVQTGEVLFIHQRDGRLVGRTFDGGTKFLHLDYALDPGDPSRTRLKVTPEVRKFSAEKHWETLDGRLQEVPRYEGLVFSELSAEFSVGPEQFLVIGPSETATLESLVGSRFLTTEENNVTYETVICVTPQPVRVERSGG
ncbi:MAG: hypothetical protein V2A79_11435 [Planctomycetota bacterium]